MPDYYTSQFSGEEIDEALRSAKTITDAASGDEIASSVKWRCNPNLLDNWYFGRPVNQRGGMMVPPGTTYLTSPGGDVGGVTDKYYPAKVYDSGSYVFTKDGASCYVDYGFVVPGYCTTGYTVDRWKSPSSAITAQIADNGITFSTSVTSGATEVCEYFENTIPAGTLLTVSAVITKSEAAKNGVVRLKYADNTVGVSSTFPDRAMNYELVSVSQAAEKDVIGFVYRISNGDGYTVHAAKLELGDAQTLAHKENGVWILNEVPDYGEQLARCRDYCRKIKYAEYTGFAMGVAMSANFVRIFISFEDMRTVPAVDLSSANGLFLSGASGDVFGLTFSLAWSAPNCIVIDATKTGAFTAGQIYFLRNDATSFILASADL